MTILKENMNLKYEFHNDSIFIMKNTCVKLKRVYYNYKLSDEDYIKIEKSWKVKNREPDFFYRRKTLSEERLNFIHCEFEEIHFPFLEIILIDESLVECKHYPRVMPDSVFIPHYYF